MDGWDGHRNLMADGPDRQRTWHCWLCTGCTRNTRSTAHLKLLAAPLLLVDWPRADVVESFVAVGCGRPLARFVHPLVAALGLLEQRPLLDGAHGTINGAPDISIQGLTASSTAAIVPLPDGPFCWRTNVAIEEAADAHLFAAEFLLFLDPVRLPELPVFVAVVLHSIKACIIAPTKAHERDLREPGEQGQANQDDGEAKANLAVPFHSGILSLRHHEEVARGRVSLRLVVVIDLEVRVLEQVDRLLLEEDRVVTHGLADLREDWRRLMY
mmetsp:Transcript_68744/g.161118  ORF Transcript_68744/g.161118 Transcript_68744/m.161118 type:complete len:270 (-) Transcript_68744:17-826(-)